MISQTMQDAINTQIKAEFDSAYLYLSMAAYFEGMNLSGFARWMHAQAKEEIEHGMKFYHYVFERGGQVILFGLETPDVKFSSALDVFEKTLKHEQKVTSFINKLYEQAIAEKDYPTQILLQWYIGEQVEEEGNATKAIEMLKMAEGKSYSLLALDHQMGMRGRE